MDVYQKKPEHLQAGDPHALGEAWVWRAMALPSRWRVGPHLSHQRREKEAIAFLAKLKARTDGRPPLLTSDKLPAYVDALIANDSTPEPPPVNRGPGRPRPPSRQVLDPEGCDAQVDKRREQGRVVEVRRRIIFGTPEIITEILGSQQINTSYVERDNLTSRQSHGRLVRTTRSHSKKAYYLQQHLDLEDAVFNCVPPHLSLRVALPQPINSRKWQQRTPAMAAGLTDHMWPLEELLSYRVPPGEVTWRFPA